MLHIAESPSQSRLLAKRTERGALRRLARGIYSDDFASTPAEQIAAGILAIVGHLCPDAYVSHCSAVLRTPIAGHFFISTHKQNRRPIELPGVTIVRLPALTHPETERVDAPTPVFRTRDTEPRLITVAISTTLQAAFESIMSARTHLERRLPDSALFELVDHLSARDVARAVAFARRNNLDAEYERFNALAGELRYRQAVRSTAQEFQLYFYNWQIGTLSALGSGEFRFEYQAGWRIELSRELPLRDDGRVSYEGPRMPAFFENLLPEGWTESRVLRTHGLDRTDHVGLLASTRKYLSNLTLRPLGIPDEEFRFDTHNVRFADLAPDAGEIIRAQEYMTEDPDDSRFWRNLKQQGAVRLSGIQAKLPVSLTLESGHPSVRIGDLRHTCTHILKFKSNDYQFLVENEWATMDLARRCGLSVAAVRIVEFGLDSLFQGRSLLVERYDVPSEAAFRQAGSHLELVLQEDACSLLVLPRGEKYKPSVERVADALVDLGLSADPATAGIWSLLRHVVFSWLVGNGDLHAKTISALRIIRQGQVGAAPTAARVEYAPLYDLVNTALAIKGDDLALPINGRQNKLRVRDFIQLASRWHGDRAVAEQVAVDTARAVREHLESVLATPHLPLVMTQQYRALVNERLKDWGA